MFRQKDSSDRLTALTWQPTQPQAFRWIRVDLRRGDYVRGQCTVRHESCQV